MKTNRNFDTMTNFEKVLAKLLPAFQEAVKLLLGLIVTIFVGIFLFISIPVFLFRFIVKFLAKILRPDFDEIFDGQSHAFTGDYFSKSAPRANVVACIVVEGNVTLEEMRDMFLRTWIYNSCKPSDSPYKKFHQVPERWLGFTFWKKAIGKFRIENHTHLLSDIDKAVSPEDLQTVVEKLVNTPLPQGQSPWDFYLIKNYHDPSHNTRKRHSVMIFRWHHCLTDGFAILIAIMQAIYEGFTVEDLESPKVLHPKRSLWQKLWYLLTLPWNVVGELTYVMSHYFRHSTIKLPDSKKNWKQVCATSQPIPKQLIKDIKNLNGVSFTSVLLSAMSSAVHKSGLAKNEKSVLCMSVLPIPGKTRQPGLTNYVTGALFDLSVTDFVSPVDRLQEADKMLQTTRNSVIPYVFHLYTTIVGCHFYPVVRILLKNKFVPIGLTNFAGVPRKLGREDRVCKGIFGATGGLEGDAGIVFTVVSHHDQHVRILATVEEGLMSRKQVTELVKRVSDEILKLNEIR